jgi:membrane protein implicated in regulation of membrane protease activity
MTSKKKDESRRGWGVGHLAALLCLLVIATLFALGQAITFAWLSATHVDAARLESLQWRFWSYAALVMTCAVFDIVILWKIWRGVQRRRKGHINNK